MPEKGFPCKLSRHNTNGTKLNCCDLKVGMAHVHWSCHSIYDHAICIGMKKTQLAIKNGANVIGHIQPVHCFYTMN